MSLTPGVRPRQVLIGLKPLLPLGTDTGAGPHFWPTSHQEIIWLLYIRQKELSGEKRFSDQSWSGATVCHFGKRKTHSISNCLLLAPRKICRLPEEKGAIINEKRDSGLLKGWPTGAQYKGRVFVTQYQTPTSLEQGYQDEDRRVSSHSQRGPHLDLSCGLQIKFKV